MPLIHIPLKVSIQWLNDHSKTAYFKPIEIEETTEVYQPELIDITSDSNQLKMFQVCALNYREDLLDSSQFYGTLLPLAFSHAPQDKHIVHTAHKTAVRTNHNHTLLSIPAEALNTKDAVEVHFMVESELNEAIDTEDPFMTEFGTREGLLFDNLQALNYFVAINTSTKQPEGTLFEKFKSTSSEEFKFRSETILLSNSDNYKVTVGEITTYNGKPENKEMRIHADCYMLYESRALSSLLESPFDDSKWYAFVFPQNVSPALIKKALPETWKAHCKLASGQPIKPVRSFEGGKNIKIQNSSSLIDEAGKMLWGFFTAITTPKPAAKTPAEQSLLIPK